MEPSPSKFQVPHSGSHDIVSPAIIMAFMEDMHGDQDDLIIIMCFYWPASDISWNCSQCHANRGTVQSEPADRAAHTGCSAGAPTLRCALLGVGTERGCVRSLPLCLHLICWLLPTGFPASASLTLWSS